MSILVIGGGIAGIQASLDLANQGIEVVMVEKKPSIGGVMAQLDKTFPTNDCSICIEAPKMAEVIRHPGITLLTNSEVKKVDRESNGKFRVKIEKKPRYVNEKKCKACGACAEACLLKGKIPNEFDLGLSKRSAIYILFPQAIPLRYAVDPDHCIFIRKGKCGESPSCKKACPADAIDFDQKKEEIEVEAEAIIVAAGFELFQPKGIYGFGVYDNVITSLQFERLVNAAGPTKGKLSRLSDGEEPESIAWIQCVGSRDERSGRSYCSQVCCMYATKEALIAKEHNSRIEGNIFYIDIRANGKGFEEYYTRAKTKGVNYIRAKPGKVVEDEDKGLIIFYEDTEQGKAEKLKVDLLVLSPAIFPPGNNTELARILGIELDKNGFLIPEEGIYVCGCASFPKDIPESIVDASAAAIEAARLVREREFFEHKLPEEKGAGEAVRIGVFVCHCGTNIAGFLDSAEVARYAASLPDVVFADHPAFACSEDALNQIKEAIKNFDLNRIVIASCTPRTHEPLFRTAIRESGLNKYLLEFVNIREQCSWVHMSERKKATQKAKDLVRMGAAKARLLHPLSEGKNSVIPEALVIGGGIAGLTSSLTLANSGYKVRLVEKESELGGTLRKLNKLFPYDLNPKEILDPLITKVRSNNSITIHVNTQVKNAGGHIGNFEITLSDGQKFDTGVIITATGFSEIEGRGYNGYGEFPNVITMLELEEKIKQGTLPDLNDKNAVIINCVGAREEAGRTYCCKIGCNNSVKNAKYLKALFPSAKVYVLYQDMRVTGENSEEYYREVREKVHSIRYSKDRLKIESQNGKLILSVYNTLLQIEQQIEVDLAILTLATEGARENIDLMKILKVPLSQGNFFSEAHPKLRPLDFAKEGVYLCGCAHSPKSVAETISQAQAAACRASIPLARKTVVSEALTASVNEKGCMNCGFCYSICPFDAVKLRSSNGRTVAEIDPVLCKGCGTCAAGCLPLAIQTCNFTGEQIIAQIREAFSNSAITPRILAFTCNWCSYAGADLAGMSRIQYPPNVRIIRVMCSGRVDPLFVFEAFKSGADGVLISGCHPGDCHYINGNAVTELRYSCLKSTLKYLGIAPERLRLEWISATEGEKFALVINEFTEQISKLQTNI